MIILSYMVELSLVYNPESGLMKKFCLMKLEKYVFQMTNLIGASI